MGCLKTKTHSRSRSRSRSCMSVDLPYDAIAYILYLLPLKAAIKLCLLSKRFQNALHSNKNLDFGVDFARKRETIEEFICIVDRIVFNHVGPKINRLRLFFDPRGNGSKVSHWIQFAVSKGVEELDLDFSKSQEPFYFPSNLLDNASVSILRLSCSHFNVPSNFNGLRWLSTLVLRKVKVSNFLIQVIDSSCVLLKSLELRQCKIYDSIYFSPNSKIRKFKLLNCRHGSIHINIPKLTSLHYRGHINSLTLSSDLSILNDVILCSTISRGHINRSMLKQLFSNLSRLVVLTINVMILEFLAPSINDGKADRSQISLPNLEEFQISMEPEKSYCNPLDIAFFLKDCPRLERVFINMGRFQFEARTFWEEHVQRHFDKLGVLFHHLKHVEVKGFKFHMYELQLLKFFFEKSIGLETLVLITPRNYQPKFFAEDILKDDRLSILQKICPNVKIIAYEHLRKDTCLHPRHTNILGL